MGSIPPLEHSLTRGLLQPSERSMFKSEEDMHPWTVYLNRFTEYTRIYRALETRPLLRVWDTCSGSIPDQSAENRMLARLPRGELVTKEVRKASLAVHADNGNWTDTPYISFTSRPDAASDLAEFRRLERPKRGDQYLVAIDPRHRLLQGLPILNMKHEMAVYRVDNPYDYDYYTDHYVCLWKVTPGEIIRIWSWNDLRRDNNWYENIIMPAFRAHGTARHDITDVDALASTFARTQIGHESALRFT